MNVRLNNEAVRLAEKGDFPSAIKLLSKALLKSVAQHEALDNYCPTELYSSYDPKPYVSQGEFNEGMRTFSELVYIPFVNEALLDEDMSEATVYYNLGIVHVRMKQDDEACPYFEKTVSIKKKNLSFAFDDDPHFKGPSSVAVLSNIGHIKYRIGLLSEALAMYQEALEIARHQYGDTHLYVSQTLNSIGVANLKVSLCGMDDGKEWTDPFVQALEIRKSIPDEACSDETATILNNFGRAQMMQGAYKEALQSYEEALKIRSSVLKNAHLDTAATLFNIGEAYQLLNHPTQALEMYQRFFLIASIYLEDDCVDLVCARKAIADLYSQLGESDKALEYYLKTLKGSRKIYGPIHLENSSILNRLGNLFYEHRDQKNALKMYEEGLKIERQLHSTSDRNTLITILNIARIYHHQQNWTKALLMFEEGLQIQRNLGDDEALSLASTLNSVGLVYDQLGRFTPALKAVWKKHTPSGSSF
jgi:tetratricopeptide (TPR) repeat protein